MSGSALSASPIALGTAAFGDNDRGCWNVGEYRAHRLVRHAFDRGVTLFDTGSSYGGGLAERRLGDALASIGHRDAVQIVTKLFFPSTAGGADGGLSRAAMTATLDRSLSRLRTDHVDMLMIHRWDPQVPLDETLAALDSFVRSGRVRSLGASSMSAWRLMKALSLQRHAGYAPFAAMQGYYNFLYREEEREMIPLCREEGLHYMAWSPLARGRLAGPAADRGRLAADPLAAARHDDAVDAPVLAALDTVSAETGIPQAALALRWLRERGAQPVIGASTEAEINIAVNAVTSPMPMPDLSPVERAYRPHAVLGFDPKAEQAVD
ncbi:MAG: aldo/keto reductase [Sphingomonadales bacterium]|nr:MAG: aldo/keto reductase [Sphingomonadales bacterium]